jgi:hypothetical protein
VITKPEITAAIAILAAIADCVRELKRVPAGHLYTLLMTKLTLAQFNEAIALLIQTNQVTREGDELIWKGGAA